MRLVTKWGFFNHHLSPTTVDLLELSNRVPFARDHSEHMCDDRSTRLIVGVVSTRQIRLVHNLNLISVSIELDARLLVETVFVDD